MCLYQYSALPVYPAGAATYLDKQLSHTFTGPEVCAEKPLVSIDDPDQRQVREMVALRQHLCADKDISLPVIDAVKHLLHGVLTPCAVPVDPDYPRVGEYLCQCFSQAFRAMTQLQEFIGITLRACLR